MSVMWAILSIRVENKPGILFKVTLLFRARNFVKKSQKGRAQRFEKNLWAKFIFK